MFKRFRFDLRKYLIRFLCENKILYLVIKKYPLKSFEIRKIVAYTRFKGLPYFTEKSGFNISKKCTKAY